MTEKTRYRAERRSLAHLLAAVSLLLSACTEEAVPEECVCSGDSCPQEVCNISIDLPASCSFSTAEVTIDGDSVGSATPGARFATCDETLPVGSTAEVQISAPGFEPGATTASCDAGGAPAEAAFCTLLFKLGESCRGVVETATVVVDSVEMGETAMDEPFVPCALLIPGEEVQGTIRAGTSLVLTTPLRCVAAGDEPSLIMECR